MINFLLAFILTVIIESVIAVLIGIRKREDLLIIFFMNLITNPAANYLYQVYQGYFRELDSGLVVGSIEFVVVIVEMVILKYGLKYGYVKALGVSLLFNLGSYLFGVVFL